MTTLSDAQRAQVRAWIAQGQQLAEIQNRLAQEFGVRMTYMEVKLLVSELNVLPKDKEPPPPADLNKVAAQAQSSKKEAPSKPAEPGKAKKAAPSPGQVSLTVDEITRPGALASGDVTFSDGKKAKWYLDELGRLGLIPEEQGYRPSPADVEQFQMALEREMARLGF